MKANELRVGNWLQFENGVTPKSFVQVNAWFLRQLVHDHKNDNPELNGYYSGIPLTPEILEKAGFVYKESGDEVFEQEWHIDGHELIWGPTSDNSYCCDYHCGNEIQYLHQLQNLYFALTGEELEIEL
jgi:hypothetical protein